jgi:hypothetical protein
MKTNSALKLLCCCLLPVALCLPAWAQGSAFTYQGRLDLNGAPAHGTYDFQFSVRDALTNGVAVGANPLAATLAVSNGLFTVTLDPGSGVFTGADRWLEIAVKTNGAALFTTLSPRQKITAAPYAIYAGGVTASGISGTIAPANIGAESITTGMLAPGAVGANQLAAGAVTTAALADGAVTAPKMATVTNWYALMITNPTPALSDSFGYALAGVGSDRMLIGAYADNTGATNAGAAYLFSLSGALLTTFTNPTPAALDSFGVSVAAVASDRVLIGAYGDGTGATNAGAVYLFSTSGTLLTTFTNPTPVAFDYFGYTVAAVGSDRVLMGAYGHDTGATDAGTAYLFTTNGTLLTTLTNPTPAAFDYFGRSLAAVGSDRVLIGAYGDNTGATDAGAAYLFTTNGALLTTFTNPAPAAYAFLGVSVAAVGSDRVLLGAHGVNTGATNAGAAYLFRTNGALLTTFTNPTPAAFDFFGRAVAAVGSDQVLIGAYGDGTGATNAGAAYLFRTDGTLLATFTNPTPAAGDVFGNAVAAVGSGRVLIGARWDDAGATDAGAAYLFSVETYTPGLVADGVRHGSITTASLADGAVTAAKIGGVLLPSQIPDLDASKITSGTVPVAALGNAWQIGGNAGTTAGTQFLGTTDTNALEFKVNNQRALRLEPNVNAPNVIGGSPANVVTNGIYGAVIAGGGSSFYPNRVGANFGTVVGGSGNTASGNAATAMGQFTRARGDVATAIGWYSEANGFGSLAAGSSAKANHDGSFVWADNTPAGFASTANNQFLIRAAGGVGIGTNNPQSALHVNGTVTATGFSGNAGTTLTLGTTDTNALEFKVNNQRALRLEPGGSNSVNVIGGWLGNGVAPGVAGATIGGGGAGDYSGSAYTNRVEAHFGTVSGGMGNTIQSTAYFATIGGGRFNTIETNAADAAIGGGHANKIHPYAVSATIGGGSGNVIHPYAHYPSIGGGSSNEILANSQYATIPGGLWNTATNFAFAAGRRAMAIHTGAFVWADSTGNDIASTVANSVTMRASGGYRLFSDSSSPPGSGVTLAAGGTAWAVISDRDVKKDFAPVDQRTILEKLAALPLTQWHYQWESPDVTPHIGPMAQDFKAAFYPGTDDKTITTQEADGVALAAIQGLNQKVDADAKQKDAEIAELKRELSELRQLIRNLKPQPDGGGQ